MNRLTRSGPNGCSCNAALCGSLSGSWRLVLRKLMQARPRSCAAFSRKPVCAVRQRTRLPCERATLAVAAPHVNSQWCIISFRPSHRPPTSD
jgi:hypothetical protein